MYQKICEKLKENAIGVMVSPELLPEIVSLLQNKQVTVLDSKERDESRRQCRENGCEVLLFDAASLRAAEDVFWGTESVKRAVCIDSTDVQSLPEGENLFMNRELWEMIGMMAEDDIAVGGWKNSYNGEPFSETEMREFSENVYSKLQPYLGRETRVLEIGCASGLTMFRIALETGFYLGTDLSGAAIERNKAKVSELGMSQIKLETCPAHEIDTVAEDGFDIVIINSVVQCFHGFLYLEKLIEKLLKKVSDKAILFFGDIMDLDKKDALYSSMKEYADQNGSNMTGDLSNELFVPQRYFNTLRERQDGISRVECTEKIHTVENELTRYRYDAMVFIDRSAAKAEQTKWLLDASDYMEEGGQI